MSEQRIVVETPDYEAAADMLHGYVHLLNNDIETPGLDAAKNIVDAALAVSGIRIVELPDMEKLREALDVMPGCGHWKDDVYQNSWSLRLMDEAADWRIVCEAIIEVSSGQRYCMDEGPRIEPGTIESWFRAARWVLGLLKGSE